jgi:hypothetical protein
MDPHYAVDGWYDGDADIVEIVLSDPDLVDFYSPEADVWVFFDSTSGHLSGITLESARRRYRDGSLDLAICDALLGPAAKILHNLLDGETSASDELLGYQVAALADDWENWRAKFSGGLAAAR